MDGIDTYYHCLYQLDVTIPLTLTQPREQGELNKPEPKPTHKEGRIPKILWLVLRSVVTIKGITPV